MGGGLFGSAQTVPTQQQQATNQIFNQTGNQATTATQATTANPFALDLANQFQQYLYAPNAPGQSGGLHGTGGPGGIPGMDFFQPFFGGWQEAAGKQIMNLNNVINPYAQTNIPAWMTQGADYMNQGAGIINQAPGLINQGAGFITQSGQPITGEDVSGFYNPMAGNITAQLQNIFGQQNLANRLGSTASAGGTGADRAAVAQGLLANQQGLSAGQTYAQLYQQALQAAQQQKAQQLQSGQGLVGAGGAMGGVGAGLAGVGQALGNQGLATGQLALASDAAAKEQAEAQAFHGLRQMQMLASALPGFIGLGQTGAATQATQTNAAGSQAGTGTGLSQTTYPAPPLLPQIAGLGATGLGLAGLAKGSDPRAKTDIQKYGRDPETGLPLYAFRYKGDPKSYPKVVGPMATDVKKKYPGAVVELGKDEYQDGGYVDGVSDNYSDDNSDYSSDDNQQSSAEADRAAKQRLARAQQAMKLLATTKVFQPKYQPTRSAGIKMPPTPWQMGRFAVGGAVPGMGMAPPGSPNRGAYPQALNYGSLLGAQRSYPMAPMYSSPMMAGAMAGRFGFPTGRGYAPIRQEGGRVDANTAHAWGPEEYEVDPRPPDMRGPPDRTGYVMRRVHPGRNYRDALPSMEAIRKANQKAVPGEQPGIYADGGAVMQSPPQSVSGVQPQPQQAAAPAAPAAQPDANQQQGLPTAAAPAIGGILPPTPAAAANPAQLLSALSIGMLMGSASSNRMRGRGFQKGGRIPRYQDGGTVPVGRNPTPDEAAVGATWVYDQKPAEAPLPGVNEWYAAQGPTWDPQAAAMNFMQANPSAGQGSQLGGWGTYENLAAHGGNSEGKAFGQTLPSTDNYRLLPPGYQSPNYMMRNGNIIDKYFAQYPGLYLAMRGTDALPQAGDRDFPMSSAGIGTGTRGYFWPGQIGPWHYQQGTVARGGRIKKYQDGGEVGDSNANPWGLPPLDMMPPMPRPRPLPGMEPLTTPMPHYTGPGGIYESGNEDVPLPRPRPEAAAEFSPDDEEAPAGPPGGGGFMGRDASMALMQAGLGMLAASGRRDSRGLPMSGLAAIGEGAGKGLSVYQQRQDEAVRQGRLQRAQAIQERNTLDLIRHRQLEERMPRIIDESGARATYDPKTKTWKAVEVAPTTADADASAVAFDAEAGSPDIGQRIKSLIKQGVDKKTAQKIAPGLFDNDTVDMMARQALSGDRSVFANLGRGVAGPYNIAQVRQQMNRLARLPEFNMSGADIAAANANFNAQTAAARTAAVREANVETAINEAKRMFPLALESSEKLSRTDFVPVNKLMKMWREGTSNPEQAAFAASLQGVITAYSQAMSRTGVNTVHSQERGEALLSDVTSHAALKAKIDMMAREMDQAKIAPEETRREILRKIANKKAGEPLPFEASREREPVERGIKEGVEKPVPTQKDRDYVKAHPEVRQRFIDRFGVEP